MTFIVPFEADFCGHVRKVYAVNEDDPKNTSGHITTSKKCPHRGERNYFRVYEPKNEREEDGWIIETYDCKCPECEKEFNFEIELEIYA